MDTTGAGGGDPALIDGTSVGDAAGVNLQGGAGIAIAFNSGPTPDTASFATASSEQGFLASGALTCGASTNGKMQVHTTALQYCDNAGTPTLRYAAYGDSAGVATTAAAATALAANGGNCSAGSAPLGVDTLGAVEGCFVVKPTLTKCINVDTASTVTSWLFFKSKAAITVTAIDCIVDAATSVVMTLRECDANAANCTDTEAAITCATTNSPHSGGIDDAAVDSGDWMRVTRGTVTGTITQASLCMTYTEP